jgi:CO dehydrogenase nickel-insertion accessory protein CooC1
MAKALEERGLKPQGVVPYISLFEEAALRGNPLPLQKEVIRNIESLASALAFGSQLESAFITSCMK